MSRSNKNVYIYVYVVADGGSCRNVCCCKKHSKHGKEHKETGRVTKLMAKSFVSLGFK